MSQSPETSSEGKICPSGQNVLIPPICMLLNCSKKYRQRGE